MNEKTEIIRRIKDSLTLFEKEVHDEYDLITSAFSVWHNTTDLIRTLWDKKKIEDWKNEDDPSFYRFCSKLKMALELQRDYLNTISDQLALEGDEVSQKIKACEEQINSLLEQERTIFKEVSPLIEREDDLRETSNRLDILLRKRKELEGIEKKLSGIDIGKLETEVAKQEKRKDSLMKKYKPLLERKQTLQSSLTELKEAISNISAEIVQLETAYGEEANRLTESIPQWIDNIKNRRVKREEKGKELMESLAEETEELKKTERDLQEHINKINEFASFAMTNQEILRTHFDANKAIGSRFSVSLPDIQDDLSNITDTIENELTRFDELLRTAQKRIQEIASEFKPIGIGG